MNQEKNKSRSNKIVLLLILGLVAFIIYFVFFVNVHSFLKVISQTNLSIFAIAFIAYVIGIFFASLTWQSLLNSILIKIKIKNAFLFTWAGLFFDATIPQIGWSGDIAKTYLFSKFSNYDAGKIGACVVGQKIMQMTITVAALSAGLILVLLNYSLPTIVTVLFVIVLVLSFLTLGIVYYVSNNPKATGKLLNWSIKIISFFRSNWKSEIFREKATEVIEKFHVGIRQLTAQPKALVKPVLCILVSWIFDVSVTFIVFIALGYPAPVDKILIVYTLAGTLQTVGITTFGFTEIIMTTSYTILGLPGSLSLSVTLLTRAVNLWFRLIVGYAAFQWTGMQILREKKQAQVP